MAEYNEILVGRFNRALQKIMGMKGGPPSAQLAGEIMPIFPLFSGVEHRNLEGWDRFGLFLDIPAGGIGNRSLIRLRNPGQSNVIAVIEKMTVTEFAAETIQIVKGSAIADLGTSQAPVVFDTRGRVGPTLALSSSNNVALASLTNATTIHQVNTPATAVNVDLILTINQEITLNPGAAIQFQPTADNTDLSALIWWRERFLEESERT